MPRPAHDWGHTHATADTPRRRRVLAEMPTQELGAGNQHLLPVTSVQFASPTLRGHNIEKKRARSLTDSGQAQITHTFSPHDRSEGNAGHRLIDMGNSGRRR